MQKLLETHLTRNSFSSFLLQTLQRLVSHRDGIQTLDILQIEPEQQPDMETPKGEFWYF